jgi:hypothetical protein
MIDLEQVTGFNCRKRYTLGKFIGVLSIAAISLTLSACISGNYDAPSAQDEKIVNSGPCETITNRNLNLMLKSPEDYLGQNVIIWGEIYSFDSNTGQDGFMAYVSNRDDNDGYFSSDKAVYIQGTESMLKKFVEGDIFRACLTIQKPIDGEYTLTGEETLIPSFTIRVIRYLRSQ